jgi:hypothetical protein
MPQGFAIYARSKKNLWTTLKKFPSSIHISLSSFNVVGKVIQTGVTCALLNYPQWHSSVMKLGNSG